MPDAGVWLTQAFEDLYLKTYKDPGAKNGLPITGGWGSIRDENNNPFQLGVTHTKEYWDNLFFDQLRNKYYPALLDAFGSRLNGLSTMAKGALLSIGYNCGPDIFTNRYGGYETTARVLQSLDPGAIAAQILFINRGGDGDRMLGLFRRRFCEGKLLTLTYQPLRAEIPSLKEKWVTEADILWPKWLAKHGS